MQICSTYSVSWLLRLQLTMLEGQEFSQMLQLRNIITENLFRKAKYFIVIGLQSQMCVTQWRKKRVQLLFFPIAEMVEIMYVKNHKTFNTHGSAKCTLQEREALAIKAYVRKIRLVESKYLLILVIF